MKHINLKPDRYRESYESPDIRVSGMQTTLGRTVNGSTHLVYNPHHILEHGFAATEGKLDHWVLFAVQHPTVIDNHGGSGAERARMAVELAVGEPFTLDYIGGTWMLANRDQRNLEGDGVKPVPYEEKETI